MYFIHIYLASPYYIYKFKGSFLLQYELLATLLLIVV